MTEHRSSRGGGLTPETPPLRTPMIDYKTLSRYIKKFLDKEIKGEDTFSTTVSTPETGKCLQMHKK